MSKSIFLAATVLILLGTTVGWSQDEATQSAPVEGQTPAQPGADPFGPPESGEPRLEDSDASAGQESTYLSDLERTPVFLAEEESQASDNIVRQLQKPIRDSGFNFAEVPLAEVVSFLRDEYDIEVQLDQAALDDLGLSPEDTVTVNVRNVSLQNALKLMLKQHDLTYIIADEVLLITSEDEALSRLSVRVYPVGDLLQPKEGQPQMSAASADDLIDTIISLIASDTWSDNGGGEADIRAFQPGLLLVSQTQAVHEEIANLLSALRRARQHELALPYTPVEKKAKPTNFGGGGYGGGGGAPADRKSDQPK